MADLTLKPGEMLYIPRGWWHSAIPLGELSMHLTMGFVQPTGIDLIVWLTERLRHEEAYRRNLPVAGNVEQERAHADLLRQLLERAWEGDVIGDFLNSRDVRAVSRPRFGFPWAADPTAPLPPTDEFRVRLVTPRARLADDADRVVLFADNKRVLLSTKARSVVEALQDGREHSFADLCAKAGGLSAGSVRALLSRLLLDGLLVATE